MGPQLLEQRPGAQVHGFLGGEIRGREGARNADNSYRPPARNERAGGGGQRGAQPAAASGGQSAMAAAFAKLQGKG